MLQSLRAGRTFEEARELLFVEYLLQARHYSGCLTSIAHLIFTNSFWGFNIISIGQVRPEKEK